MPRRYGDHPASHGRQHADGYDDSEVDGDEDSPPIYTTRRSRSAYELREQATLPASMRLTSDVPRTTGLSAFLGEGLVWRRPGVTQIITTSGQLGPGETEIEGDEQVSNRATLYFPLGLVAGVSKGPLSIQPSHLPNTRVMPASEPLVPPTVVTMVLFESSRLLSIVPASLGALFNAWCVWCPPGYSPTYGPRDNYHHVRAEQIEGWGRRCLPDRGDYFVAMLWALLTAHQCLKLTTGLLHRWRVYYSPISALIRLLALQAICWPATHFTLEIVGSLGANPSFDGGELTILESALLRWSSVRPDVCWAVIGTTTCVSRSIQIWVTSNLLLPSSSSSSSISDRMRPRTATGKETRTWDWGVVARVCMVPAGFLYFVMAWIAAWRREVGGC